MSTSESSHICRLCGHSCEQYIDIFSRLDCVNMLQYKIKHLIDIAVSRGDNLSHSVCLSCVSKLENLWCFRNTCHQVQIELRKMNQSSTNYDRLKSELAMRHSNLLLNLGLGKNYSISRPILGDEGNFNNLSNDVSKQNSTMNSDVHSDSSPEADASVSNYIETMLIDSRNFDSEISHGDDDNDDYYCNIEEKYSISIASKEDMDCNNFPISKITEDNMCDSFPKSKKQSDKKSTITLSATSSSGNEKFLGHNYRMEVDVNSDFLCNRFPHLLVESKMGSKHMIYTVFPDLSKFDYEHDYKVNSAGEYLTSETFDLKNPNITRTLIQWINNLLKGEISLMPYYSSWLDNKKKLNLILKCILCKKIMNGDRQSIMNHVADHLICICPVCGTLCRSICSFKNHLHKHESVTLKCSTCNENFGSDFEKFKVHKRSHYKFECFSCQFECSDKEEWLKHLKKDRKEYCSSDCCLFYGSIEELQEHVSELSTIGGFVCGACGMAYHSEEYLKLHLRVHGLQHGSNTTSRSTCNSTGTAPQIEHSKKFIDGLKNSSLDKHFDTLKSILDNKIDLNKFQTSSTGPGGNVITGFMCFKCSEILTNEKKFRIHIGNHFMMTCDASLCKRYIKGTAKLGEHFKRCIFKRRICVICKNDVWLETTTEYLEHLSLHQKRRICIYCQVVFPTAQNLDTHVRTNHNKNKTEDGFKHFCELCNETLVVSYKSFESFKINHFKENHPDQLERFVCDICGEKFDRKCLLNSHTNSKHAGKSYKNNDKFICAYCSKEFANKHTVKSHIRQHMNEKGFKCDICNKGFNRETSLTKHKLDMHSVKKHLCNLCGKRFSYPSALKDHAERAHAYVRSTGSKRKAATKHPISTENQESTSSEEPANNSHSITTATRDHGSALYEFPYTTHHPQASSSHMTYTGNPFQDSYPRMENHFYDYVTSFEASLDTSHATMAQD